jgi:hypothetical protein
LQKYQWHWQSIDSLAIPRSEPLRGLANESRVTRVTPNRDGGHIARAVISVYRKLGLLSGGKDHETKIKQIT